MSFKIRAAAVTVATSLVAVPLTLSGTAFAQDDQPTGYVGGTVFNDLNGDGVKQGDEPGIRDVNVVVKDAQGKSAGYSTDTYGTWTVKRTPHGQYEVSYVDPKLGNTTPSTVKVEVGAGDTPAVNFGVRAGSVCGVVWHDKNEDGRRQAGEGGLAGRVIRVETLDRHVVTGADGGYCFGDLEAGRYTLSFSRKSDDPLVPTGPVGDSKFDWVSAQTQPVEVGKGEHVKGIDLGLMQQRTDLKAVQVIVDNGNATVENTFRVGDELKIYGSVVANGNAPQSLSGTLTLPEGLRILGTVGGLAPKAFVQGRQVLLPFGPVQVPGPVEFLGARVVVEKEFAGGEIKFEAKSATLDVDPSNNVVTRKINALPAQPHVDAPNAKAPEVKKTAGLANTGVDPVAAGAIGLGALALGGLAVYGARRRQNA